MNIKARDWLIFLILAILCLGFWHKLEYPRFSFVSLAYDKQKSFREAENFLKDKGIDIKGYSKAIIFDADEQFNRYLQNAAGLKEEENFIKAHDYDLFRWLIRFFRESQKEEYFVYISPRTGKVIRFRHLIEDIEARPDPGKEIAKKNAQEFVEKEFGADLDKYEFHEEKVKRYEKRTEYVFTWEKKGVYVPWKENQGGAKLLTEVTVSGEEIREFYKNKFDIPDKFNRFVEKQLILGAYLYSIFYIIFFVLLGWSINIVLKKRQEIVPRLSKKWFYYAAAFLFVVNCLDFFNNLQYFLIFYPTSARLSSFFGLTFSRWLFSTGFLIIGFIMPAIAGESLSSEVFPGKKFNTFFNYIRSSFFNRVLTQAILLGYLIFLIMLGLQAAVFYAGQRFFGVWREWHTMAQFSSASFPLLSAFVIGINASLNEEINFRLFGISLAKKYLRNSFLAILFTSLAWGMGHTMYVIFPVWFRVIEISLIGLLYGFVFIRFGIVTLVIAHYLFDVFWCSAPYLLGQNTGYLFSSSVLLMLAPLLLALSAYAANRPLEEKPISYALDKAQAYNLGVLCAFILAEKAKGRPVGTIKEELIRHNWDYLLVEAAIKEVEKSN